MHSPLARVIFTLLGGYLIILLFLIVYDWISAEYPRRPTKAANTEQIHHPVDHKEALDAIRAFSRLPKIERAAIAESLKSSLMSMEDWLTQLRRSDFEIICLGEVHEESTRNFLAREFFDKIRSDALMLEATPGKLNELIKRLDAGRDYYPLLDADIMNLLRAAKNRNPGVKIWGIEETEQQEKKRRGYLNPRDQAIAHNFWDKFQSGKRHIILFGALHCANESNWLFKNLCSRASPRLKERMLNVRVLGEHQNGPLEAFVYFLDAIGIKKKRFVIADTQSLHPRIYELFQTLNRQTLEKYRSLVVFRSSDNKL